MPTYHAPVTQTAGSSDILASDWNTDVRDNITVLRSNALSGMGELIETLAPSGVASITTATLPVTYTHIGFRAYDLVGSAAEDFKVQFNGDTGNNYRLGAIGRTPAGATGTDDSTGTGSLRTFDPFIPTTANRCAWAQGMILSYRNTTYDKTMDAIGGGHYGVCIFGGTWQPATPVAITTITFGIGSGTFSGVICVYGINN